MERPPHLILSEISSVLKTGELTVIAAMSGCSHNIFVLKLPSGRRWSLRIAKDEFAASLANRSVAIMRHIAETKPTLQIPAVIYTAKTYTVLEYIDGAPISSWNSHLLNDQKRHRLLGGLATFLYGLWTCPAPVVEPNFTATTYRDWLLNEVDKAICRSMENSGWGDPIHFIHRRARVDGLIPHQNSLGITIKHGDMNALNMLVSNDELTGVIDWDTVSFVPAPAAIQYPLFIAGIPGFYNDDVPPGMDFADDRAYLENAIRKQSADASNIADLLASSYERQFFELSLRNKRINEEYVRLRLGDMDCVKGALSDQLDEFLSINKEMENHPAVAELRKHLSMASNGAL